MRSQKIMLLLGLTVLVGASLLLFGCSDDESPTKYTGDLNDPEFLQVYGQLNDFIDSTLISFNNGLGSMSTLSDDDYVDPVHYGPVDPNAETDSSSVIYSQEGWHIVYVSYHTDNYNTVVTDSIQFLKDGVSQQSAADLETVLYKHYWMYNVVDQNVSHNVYEGNADFTFSNLDTEIANVNGTNNLEVVSTFISNDSTVEINFNFEADFSNIKIAQTGSGWAQGCPQSGHAEFALQVVYQKDDEAPDTTNWTGVISFAHGVASYSIGNGTDSWGYSQNECTAPTN